MLGLLPVLTIVRWVAAIYAVLSILIFGIVITLKGETLSIWAAAGFALSSSGVLQAALVGWFYYGWRQFWGWCPKLNKWLYPDIHGTWDMNIELGGIKHAGKVIAATAIVRQDFLGISMDVIAPDSRSVTLAAIPKKDSQSTLPQLYYVFLVTTRPRPGEPSKTYKGAAILDLDHLGTGEVTGNYWTTQETSGHYRLYNRRLDD
jgi:hypothetical protein